LQNLCRNIFQYGYWKYYCCCPHSPILRNLGFHHPMGALNWKLHINYKHTHTHTFQWKNSYKQSNNPYDAHKKNNLHWKRRCWNNITQDEIYLLWCILGYFCSQVFMTQKRYLF
jgi:hypothetical protein